MLFKNMYHMTKFNARCRKKLAFKFNKMRKTPCIKRTKKLIYGAIDQIFWPHLKFLVIGITWSKIQKLILNTAFFFSIMLILSLYLGKK